MEAAELCQRVWGVPAEPREIDFNAAGASLRCSASQDHVEVDGWQA